jgi:hypothetical protein
MQVTQERLSRLEPNQMQSEEKQYLGQQIYEYGRLILTITIEPLVISQKRKLVQCCYGSDTSKAGRNGAIDRIISISYFIIVDNFDQ